MNKTDNDLSFNYAELDYEAMVQTAELAFSRLRDNVSSELGKLYPCGPLSPKETRNLKNAIDNLAREANFLVTVAETLQTLYGMQEREAVKIVNHPLDKEIYQD